MSLGPSLQDPWVLLLLSVLPVLAVLRHRRRAYGAITYSSLGRSPSPGGRPGSGNRAPSGAWRLHLPFYCRLIALGLLILAASRPQLGFSREESLTEGIDIQVVLDISGSMAAEDFQPRNRLTVAKDVMKEFIDKRRGDRIGIVVFAGEALTKAPLTTDHQMLQLMLDSIELRTLPDGTAIGMALAAAAARLKDSDADTKVVVLVTDGVNNRGAIDPDSAATVCEGLGIKVYTVGVGTRGVVPVPMRVVDALGRERVQRMSMEVEVDEELLRSIAERTGGRFFQAIDPEGLRRIFEEIDQLEKTPMEIQRYVRYNEAFQPLVWAALAFLVFPLFPSALGLLA
ncbi:MAG: VWA domain-containing protein, partial [Holophagales bacterium]|nr:VWA domain-containing protein [Holophagales bacterium]